MKILAIETSFDETACAVVEDGVKVIASIIASQAPLHQITHGTVPEVAARAHVGQIMPVIDYALTQAQLTVEDIDAIAVTQGPGLIGSLLVGVTAAQVLAKIWHKPLLAVNHIWGHLYANFLGREELPELPVLIVSVSGGHNDLVLLREHGKIEGLGQTQDDSAGEAYDKVARMLGLPYPGGPEIDRLAKVGNRARFQLPRAWLQQVASGLRPKTIHNFDFSFSGLKTAVYTLVQKLSPLDDQTKADIACAFQEAVCDILATKLLGAWEKYQTPTVFISGGVSANQRLREVVIERFQDINTKALYPLKLSYCTDNAAMIGAAAYFAGTKMTNQVLEPNPSMWS